MTRKEQRQVLEEVRQELSCGMSQVNGQAIHSWINKDISKEISNFYLPNFFQGANASRVYNC
eukprot:6106464-Amphidinium_carterae.1